jgi:uncharacterized protein (TIGR00730 family)
MGNDPRYNEAADLLGRLIGEAELELIYGGGKIGLMGTVADAVLKAGGRVTGIIPSNLKKVELAHDGLSEMIVVESMHERKRMMFDKSDAFVTLPGGPGTLDETIEIITWRQLRLHAKPIVIVDDGGYWQPLLDLMEHTIENGFAHDVFRTFYEVVSTPQEVLPAIAELPESFLEERPERL